MTFDNKTIIFSIFVIIIILFFINKEGFDTTSPSTLVFTPLTLVGNNFQCLDGYVFNNQIQKCIPFARTIFKFDDINHYLDKIRTSTPKELNYNAMFMKATATNSGVISLNQDRSTNVNMNLLCNISNANSCSFNMNSLYSLFFIYSKDVKDVKNVIIKHTINITRLQINKALTSSENQNFRSYYQNELDFMNNNMIILNNFLNSSISSNINYDNNSASTIIYDVTQLQNANIYNLPYITINNIDKPLNLTIVTFTGVYLPILINNSNVNITISFQAPNSQQSQM